MLGTVLPMGYGEKYRSSLWVYAVGSLLGALALGAVAGSTGSLVALVIPLPMGAAAAGIGAGVIAVLYSLKEMAVLDVPAPQFARQVPQIWARRFRPRTAAFLYGAGLGAGVGTYIPVATLYVVVAWAILNASPMDAAIVVAAYGVGRALPVLFFGYRTHDVEASGRLSLTVLPRAEVPMRVVNALAMAGSAAFLITAAVGRLG